MLNLTLDDSSGIHSVLCLGAHSDDIEIGCGGTILRLVRISDIEFYWVVFGSTPEREKEARRSAKLFLKGVKTKSKIAIHKFRTSFFPYQGQEIKECFEQLKEKVSPDLIFTHYRHDLHQDHRVISELTWNSFRNHLILEYEIPKFDGDLASPNVFFHLDKPTCEEKTRYIIKSFRSQVSKHWFTEDTFLSLLRLRGIECCAPGRYAEAFYCRKVALQIAP